MAFERIYFWYKFRRGLIGEELQNPLYLVKMYIVHLFLRLISRLAWLNDERTL